MVELPEFLDREILKDKMFYVNLFAALGVLMIVAGILLMQKTAFDFVGSSLWRGLQGIVYQRGKS